MATKFIMVQTDDWSVRLDILVGGQVADKKLNDRKWHKNSNQ